MNTVFLRRTPPQMRSALAVLLWVSFLLFYPNALLAQQEVFREVIVMFDRNMIRLPSGQDSATVAEAIVASPSIQNILQTQNVELLLKAFPRFNLADTLGTALSGERVQLTDFSKVFKLRLPLGANVSALAAALSVLPGVIYAEPNGIAIPDAPIFPNDTQFNSQWGLHNTGQSGGTVDADIDAPEAWEITTGSTATKIGIIDGQMDYSGHDDLSSKTSGDGSGPGSGSWYGHATHVAGIAAAKTNNNDDVAGVDWNAQLISQRIDNTDDAGAAQAIRDAYNAGAQILNNSWTMTDGSGGPRYSTTVRLAFADAYKLNRTAVVAMGNNNTTNVYYPAGFGQGIIAVGATTRSDARWESSPTSGSNKGSHIDVAAPGADILSTWPSNTTNSNTGTSMATPHVSGIAGLLRAYNSALYNDDIEQIIRLGVDDKGTTGFDNEYGTGRVNARKAIDFLRASYSFTQSTASNGTTYSVSNTFQMTFYSTPGLADGVYNVKRHVVRKVVTFASAYCPAPYVWGRGVASNGYSYVNPNFGLGFCQPVSGAITSTNVTLETVVYEVWNLSWQYLGFKPTTPANATFGYSVLGIISQPVGVTITGPSTLQWKSWGTWTANPSGGNCVYTYEWSYRNVGDPNWLVVGTAQQYTRQMPPNDIELQVKVTSNGQIVYDTHYVEEGIDKAVSPSDESASLPESFFLSQNYPNPFNPETIIRFDLPEAVEVQLVIFDLAGREVRRLVDKSMAVGYHHVLWDGKDNNGKHAPSGVYLYQLTAGDFREQRKLALVR